MYTSKLFPSIYVRNEAAYSPIRRSCAVGRLVDGAQTPQAFVNHPMADWNSLYRRFAR